MKFRFENIPCPTKFLVFDLGVKETRQSWTIAPGDSEIEVDIPDEWKKPSRLLSAKEYYFPNRLVEIASLQDEQLITGGEYYIDISRAAKDEEHNQRSVETLIQQIHGNKELSGRQKFYVSLVSLQSYFEHLVYGMLRLSGHLTKRQFDDLSTHKNRTNAAFSPNNTDFFSTTIEICPGKDGLGTDIPQTIRAETKKIFDETRTLRNKVVHKWGYKDVGRENLVEIFDRLGENPGYHEDDDSFYLSAAFIMVRLYARASAVKNQLSLFIEREAVRIEREERGY